MRWQMMGEEWRRWSGEWWQQTCSYEITLTWGWKEATMRTVVLDGFIDSSPNIPRTPTVCYPQSVPISLHPSYQKKRKFKRWTLTKWHSFWYLVKRCVAKLKGDLLLRVHFVTRCCGHRNTRVPIVTRFLVRTPTRSQKVSSSSFSMSKFVPVGWPLTGWHACKQTVGCNGRWNIAANNHPRPRLPSFPSHSADVDFHPKIITMKS